LIETVPSIGSTSDELAVRLRTGSFVREGDWLIADRQTAGRGRQGRLWEDGAGNFMGSTVVHLGKEGSPPESLALVAALAVQQSVAPHVGSSRQAMLKWPNDVMIDGAKVAGVLLERQGQAVIVGIGVNLASAPMLPDRPAIALGDFGPVPARDEFAEILAATFALELERWRTAGLDPILRRWQAAAHPIGARLCLSESRLEGTFAGLTADGALQLRAADGTTHVVNAGEVRLAD